MRKIYLAILVIPAILGFLTYFNINNRTDTFHSAAELAILKKRALGLNGHFQNNFAEGGNIEIDSNILFPNAKLCGGCHGKDPNQLALVSSSGEDINIYDDWRSTMMANSAKDPFWRAKVRQEMLANPAHSLDLQDKCTSCHAPTGHYQAKLHDKKMFYTLDDVIADTLGLDGVNCQACHAQSPKLIGSLHSGEINYDTNFIRVAYGPYKQAFFAPMNQFVGITPVFGEHISDAGLCAGCHTLITKSVDLAGEYTGNTFVEQSTYHEWLNSDYDETHQNVTCQACHIPSLQDEIIISANYQFLTPKFPFGLHEMAGANVPMLNLLKENRNVLGISALPEHFDSTIAATTRMLQKKTLDLTVDPVNLTGDSARFTVNLINKAGHKFPSGYPSRRAWVEFELLKQSTGQPLFHSGKMTANYALSDEDSNFEPHYNTISRQDQVQIYELVPGDVNGQFTSLLERGNTALKDNRLVPLGFKTTDPVYDTTTIVGVFPLDPDFNTKPNGEEGTGADKVHYVIPIGNFEGLATINVKIWYQSMPPKWMEPLFDYDAPEINLFESMFSASYQAPVLVGAYTQENLFISPVSAYDPSIKQSPKFVSNISYTGDYQLIVPSDDNVESLQIWSANGHLIWNNSAQTAVNIQGPKGVYYANLTTAKGKYRYKLLRL